MPTLPAQAAEQAGYKDVTAKYGNSEYKMRLYEGFVGSSWVLPNGADKVELYKQQGIYKVPQTPGKPPRGPDAQSHVMLVGGPNKRNVHLRVINEPQDPTTYKGPIVSFTVKFVNPGNPPVNPVINRPDLIEIKVGADEIESIFVLTETSELQDLSAGEAGATVGKGSGGDNDETWTVDDNSKVCPPDC